jgi:membrane associated rhomboid family serine protease
MALRQDINNFFARSATPTLTVIIVINLAVFLVANLYASFSPSRYLFQYVALPSSPYLLLHRPWTLLTYMFLHYEFGHILFNLLWLYWMGRLFAEYMGEKRLIYTYIIGAFAAGFYLYLFMALPYLSLSY